MKKIFRRTRGTPDRPRKRDAQGRFIKSSLARVDWKTDNRIIVLAALVYAFGSTFAASIPGAVYSDQGMAGSTRAVATPKPRPNYVLAAVANKGIRDSSAPLQRGACQMWARLRVQNAGAYGAGAYQRYMKGTARLTGLAFLDSPYGFYRSQLASKGSIQPGDLLYKTDRENSGGAGHVGIYVGKVPGYEHLGGMVAENSSTGIRRIRGAKGWRTLREFGTVNVYVRLPVIEKERNAPSQ